MPLGSFSRTYWPTLAAPLDLLSWAIFSDGVICYFAHGSSLSASLLGVLAQPPWLSCASTSLPISYVRALTNILDRIICRAFQGMGGAGLYSLSQIVLFEVGPSDKPSLMGGLVGITLAISYVLGPILGAVISSTSQWTIIFWIKCVPTTWALG